MHFVSLDDGNNMKYDYDCVEYDQDEMSCRVLRTERQDPGNAIQYLDKHFLQCDGQRNNIYTSSVSIISQFTHI